MRARTCRASLRLVLVAALQLVAGCVGEPHDHGDPVEFARPYNAYLFRGDAWERRHLAVMSDALGTPVSVTSTPEEKVGAAVKSLGLVPDMAVSGILARYREVAGPPLLAALSGGEAASRRAAVAVIHRLGKTIEPKERFRAALLLLATRDPDAGVRGEVMRGFAGGHDFGDAATPRTQEAIAWLAREPDRDVRSAILLWILADRGGESEVVVPAVLRSSADIASMRAALLPHVGEANRKLFEAAARAPDRDARLAVAGALWWSPRTGAWAESAIITALTDADADVRGAAFWASKHLDAISDEGRSRLDGIASDDPDVAVRQIATYVIEEHPRAGR